MGGWGLIQGTFTPATNDTREGWVGWVGADTREGWVGGDFSIFNFLNA